MTEFFGRFVLDRPLAKAQRAYLERWLSIPHYVWREEEIAGFADPYREAVGLPVGPQGLYFTGIERPRWVVEPGFEQVEQFLEQRSLPGFEYVGKDGQPQAVTLDRIILYYQRDNLPGARKLYPIFFDLPATGCGWVISADGREIEWGGVGKFYFEFEWVEFLHRHFLVPWGYEVAGEVIYETWQGERGRIIASKERVTKICDRGSLWARPQQDMGDASVPGSYWMVVSWVSEAARRAIQEAGGRVLECEGEPPVILVELRYEANAYRLTGSDDLLIHLTEGIQIWSKQLHLEPFDLSPQGCGDLRFSSLYVSGDNVVGGEFSLVRGPGWTSPGVHWIAVGRVTDAAERAIQAVGGVVRVIYREPQILLVGLPYEHHDPPAVEEQFVYDFYDDLGNPLEEQFDGFHDRLGKPVEKQADICCDKRDTIHVLSRRLSLVRKGRGGMSIGCESIHDITLFLAQEVEGEGGL